jgi:hypothetical protein
MVRRERRHGAFARSMALPPGVDAKRITATATDGVLEVRVPMPAGSSKGRTIEIVPQQATGEKHGEKQVEKHPEKHSQKDGK